MKTKDGRYELEQFTHKWPLDAQYFIWGASTTADYFCQQLRDTLTIEGFIDSDPQKWGTSFLGKPVISWERYQSVYPSRKIIIASVAYPEIRASLRNHGLKELEDFCDGRYFMSAHAITERNQLILARTDLSVTEYCNLRCKHCNMLMPYFKHPKHRDLEELKADLDAYFHWVDRV